MDRNEFVEFVDLLTERQAEAFYRRHVAGEGRQDATDAMETTPSNVDNLERAAREKIRQASNLIALLDGVGYQYSAEIGTCAACDEPTRTLKPDPRSDAPLGERPMLCPECAEDAAD